MSLDVTELLVDDELGAEPFKVLRMRQVVGDDGLARHNVLEQDAVGIFQPMEGRVLRRLPAEDHVSGVEWVLYTTFPLTTGTGPNLDADIIQRGAGRARVGRGYTVTKVMDYLHYGEGWVMALLTPRSTSNSVGPRR